MNNEFATMKASTRWEEETYEATRDGVAHELERLSKSVAVLQEHAGQLLDTIGPVLTPDEPTVAVDGQLAEARRPGCAIAEQIHRTAADIDEIGRRLYAARQRVGL